MQRVKRKATAVKRVKEILGEITLDPQEINSLLESVHSSPLVNKQKALQLLLRPNVSLVSMINDIPKLQEALKAFEKEDLEQMEIQVKYETYIEKKRSCGKNEPTGRYLLYLIVLVMIKWFR